SVRFALPNFYDVLAKIPRKPAEPQRLKWDLHFEASGWDVCLSMHPNGNETITELKANRGFGITHLGTIARQDRSNFTGAAVSNLLEGLHYYLAFVRGFWCGPALASGVDPSGVT